MIENQVIKQHINSFDERVTSSFKKEEMRTKVVQWRTNKTIDFTTQIKQKK